MNIRDMVCCGVAFVIAFGLGCSSREDSSASSALRDKAVDSSKSQVVIEAKNIPSKQESLEFAQALETAIASGNAKVVNQMIGWDSILQAATRNVDVSREFRDGFVRGAKSRTETGVATQLVNVVQTGGSVNLLRVHEVDGHWRALFRVLLPEAGVNYHDMILARDAGGTVRAVDIYVFLSAETLSNTFRRVFILGAAGESQSIMGRLVGAEGEFFRNADKFQKMAQQLRLGQFQEVLIVYGSLPKSMQQEKTILLMRLQAAMNLDDEQYTASLEAFRKAHPKDPCLDMLSIDYFLLRKKFQESLASVDRLDQAIGGDPYLNVLRAGIYVEMKELAKARKLCEATIEESPNLVDAYWTLINVTMAEKKFYDTATWLTRIGEEFEIEFEDLTTIPEYSEFVESPEYERWLKGRERN